MTKDNISVSIDVTVVFRIMGDIEKNEDPQNVYRFVHHVTPRGLEEELKSAQVSLTKERKSIFILLFCSSIIFQI